MSDSLRDLQAGPRRLTQVSRALTYAHSLDEVLALTVDCAIDLLDSDKALLMLRDEDGLLRVRAARGVDEAALDRFREPLDETVLNRLANLLGPEAEQRFLGVPLVVRGGVTGMLAVRRPEVGPLDERDEWLLSALADQAAVALDSTRHQGEHSEMRGRIQALEDAQSTKNHAIRVMSHDLRSPLHAIQGYLELLASEAMGPLNEAQLETLDRIRSIGRHLASLMESVLQMARLSTDEVDFHPERVKLETILGEAVTVVSRAADEAGITIQLEQPGGLELTIDPDRLRQVVVQLLENAVKYCPAGSEVRIEAWQSEQAGEPGVEIAVADDGPGIPAEHHREVFQPYHRFAGEEGQPGSGLGLAIVKSLIEKMGGAILLESSAGEGATFRIRLPLAPR